MLPNTRLSLSPILVKIRNYWFFLRLFLRFLNSNVKICRFLVAISHLNVRQSSILFLEEMITYMSQWYVIFTICRRLISSLSSLRTCSKSWCEAVAKSFASSVTPERSSPTVSIGIPILKIGRSCDRLIFNMGIPIPGNDGLYIETGSWFTLSSMS